MTIERKDRPQDREPRAEDAPASEPLSAAEVQAAVVEFREHLSRTDADKIFGGVVGSDPRWLLSPQSLAELEKYSTATRLAALAYASEYLCISPEMTGTSYYRRFPQDAAVAAELFRECEGAPRGVLFSLVAVSMQHLRESELTVGPPPITGFERRINVFTEISERRSIAATRIMSLAPHDMSRYGVAGADFDSVCAESYEVNCTHSHVLSVDRMFGEAFAALESQGKSALLRDALANLQYNMVGNDAHNSAIIEDDVRVANINQRLGLPGPWVFAHSTVYGIEHPNVRYQQDLSALIEPMYEPVSAPIVLNSRRSRAPSEAAPARGSHDEYRADGPQASSREQIIRHPNLGERFAMGLGIPPADQAAPHLDERFDPRSSRMLGLTKVVDRFPLQRMTLRLLREFGSVEADPETRRANCECLLDFWDKNRNPVFCAALSEALSAQDAEYSAGAILARIRGSEGYRNHFAALLYRIELGRIGISEEGVLYLHRMYDLQDCNRPDYFVQRLTPQGEVGIFDEDSRLVKYFELGDLASLEARVRPEVLDFTIQTLFFGGADDTPAVVSMRERWLQEFRETYLACFDRSFFDATGVHFNNLSFREQGGYVHFAANASEKDMRRAQNMIRRFGEPGLRSFIGLQFDERLTDAIFAIAERLPLGLADEVFVKYAGVIDRVGEVDRFCRDYFGGRHEVTDLMVQEISLGLLEKAKSLLSESAALLEGKVEEETRKEWQAVCGLLDGMQAEVALFAGCFREISKHTRLKYSEVQGCILESVPATQLGEEWSSEILRIGKTRTAETYPDPVYAALVLDELKAALSSERNVFHFVHFGPHLLAFCRSETQPGQEAVYLGSLNNDPQIAGINIGMTLAADVTKALSAERPIYGYVGPGREVLLKIYEERLGFRKVDTLDDGTIVVRIDPARADSRSDS